MKRFLPFTLLVLCCVAPELSVARQVKKDPPVAQKKPLPVTANVANNGEINGDANFAVQVEAGEATINQVEFYVNGELRDTKSSIPYQFALDTLVEEEGPIDVEFRAYGSQGESGNLKLKLKVQNHLEMGAEKHHDSAVSFFSEGKIKEALIEARTALKADKNFLPAKLTLARCYFLSGYLDKAQKYAEDVTVAQPNNVVALELLSGIAVKQAFSIRSTSDREAATEAMKNSLLLSVRSKNKAADAALDAFGPVNENNLISYVDTAIKYHRYGAALTQLIPASRKNLNLATTNRILLCMIRRAQYQQAETTAREALRFLKPDAYMLAMQAVLAEVRGNHIDSRGFLNKAEAMNSLDPGVVSAKAYITMVSGKGVGFSDAVAVMSGAFEKRPETKFYIRNVLERAGDAAQTDKVFVETIQADPLLAEAMVDRTLYGIYLSKFVKDYQGKSIEAATSDAIIAAALEARPDSPQVLATYAYLLQSEGKYKDAGRYTAAAVRTSNQYAMGYYLFSGLCSSASTLKEFEKKDPGARAQRRDTELFLLSLREYTGASLEERGGQAAIKAGELDADLSGRDAPKPLTVWRLMHNRGPIPVLIPPK